LEDFFEDYCINNAMNEAENSDILHLDDAKKILEEFE
jgi:hypothetical protein